LENHEKKELITGKDITYKLLPGKLVRAEGQPAPGDKKVNEAYDNVLKVLEFYEKIFKYRSLDSNGMLVVSTVYYGKNYQNAAWFERDETRTYNQIVYGDGARVLYNFTNCINVIGHEITVS